MQRQRCDHLWLLTTLLALAAAILVAACGGAAPGQATSSTPSAAASEGLTAGISVVDYKFVPRVLVVDVGTTVTWTNTDVSAHDVVSTNGPSTEADTTDLFAAALGTGDSFSFTFDKAGTYYYECRTHAAVQAMHGTVVVK